MQTGQIITPSNNTEPTPEVPPTEQLPIEQVAAPQPVLQTSVQEVPQQITTDSGEVTWTASEYIAHDKSFVWFGLLGLGIFVLVGLTYILTKDIFATVLLGLAGLTFAIFAARPPRVLQYSIHENGITIGARSYAFTDFKSFTVDEDSALPSLMLMPLKRFLPPITIFYDPQAEEAIFNALVDYLPHEDREPDIVDRIMGRIRF